MESSSLVSHIIKNECNTTHKVDTVENTVATQFRSKSSASSTPKATNDGLHLVWTKLKRHGYSPRVIKMMMKGWRENTKKQYKTYLDQWLLLCDKQDWDPLEYSVSRCLDFLLTLFKKGLGYSAINTDRSALSCIFDNPSIGEYNSITRFMRRLILQRPTNLDIPKYGICR